MFGNALLVLALPFVLSTVYFGIRKGENNYYDSDKYDGNGTVSLADAWSSSEQPETLPREN